MNPDDRVRRLLAAAAALPPDVDPATTAVMRRVSRHRRRRRTLTLVTPVLLAATLGASVLVASDDEPRPGELRLASALTPFAACDDLTDYLAEAQLESVRRGDRLGVVPQPFSAGAVDAAGGVRGTTTTGQAASGAAPAPGAAEALTDAKRSGTNNQEAGVDEPDLVKADDDRIVTIARGRLNVVELGTTLRNAGSVALPRGTPGELLLVGDRALVLLRAGFPEGLRGTDAVLPQSTGTTVLVVDLAEPRIERSFDFEGNLVAGRLVGDTARLVLSTAAPLVAYTSSPQVRDDRVRALSADDWLPSYRVRTGNETATGRLVDCDRVSYPAGAPAPGLLTVVSVDPAADRPGTAVSVAGAGETVYANETALYVGTVQQSAQAVAGAAAPSDWVTTTLHRFDISDAAGARYTGSGDVPGQLLNQYSMSELDGRLRVATTTSRTTGSESVVSVLEQADNGALEVVGQVDGLGKGERIYAVRFVGDLGYVVTFRQIDPLYVIDLSDPRNPRSRGELKIPGYSAYLHPIGDDLLLGVGRDTDGRFGGGLQLSVFDVGDPDRPQRLHALAMAGGQSGAEFDPHAFLYWPDTATTVLPVTLPDGGVPFLGAIGYRVGADGIELLGRISHQHRDGPGSAHSPIVRSMVIGDALVTFSDRGVLASDLETLRDRAWLPYD